MTVETIEKDGVSVRILYGFGRIQRARYIFNANLPDGLRRIQGAGGQVEDSDIDKVGPEEILDYNAKVFPQIVKLVLQSASDQGEMTIDEYVDNAMPETIGLAVVSRMKAVLDSLNDSKKT